ncbi:MAG: right-handed parallel beta-helix repeat-containing protein [Chitinispirillaceae bacterium]|nr:right-handed parallel beta-helix repeat-containing protein [Chitinispirillaceae bacterium]
MLDANNPLNLWVSSSGKSGGNGTRENPFNDIGRAVAVVKPGMTIALMAGVYGGDRTFDISGTIDEPIRITAEQGAGVEVRAGCWFFYDVSDIIVSGLTFREAPHGALSVIGSCTRNRFESLRFMDCGSGDSASCSLFFGGSGGSCNIVDGCRFERLPRRGPSLADPAARAVGLMVSEGDSDGGEPISDHVFRKNRFVNYDYGIMVGAGDAPAGKYGHLVENNTVEQCGTAGILVKCSDTTVRGNKVMRCPDRSIAVVAGRDCVVEANRVIDCGSGIQMSGSGHTAAGNCIVRCDTEALGVNGASAENIIVENNTFVGFGRTGIRIDSGATAIVRRNLFWGPGKPYAWRDDAETQKERSLIAENIAAGGGEEMAGVVLSDVIFKNADGGDFSNDSGFGASGPVLTPEAFDPESDAVDEADGYRSARSAEPDEETGEEKIPETAAGADFESFMSRFYSKETIREDMKK